MRGKVKGGGSTGRTSLVGSHPFFFLLARPYHRNGVTRKMVEM